MRTLILLIACSLLCGGALAQGKPRETLEPTVTEVWDLKPVKITPATTPGGAPSDAIIIFDGKDLSKWASAKDGSDAKWEVKDGAFTVTKGPGDIKKKQAFGDMQLHIEWRTPAKVEGDGQGRGNSGIFLQERYELQVLDSYESPTYSNGQASSIYKQAIPLVNACLKPGEWQTYDVIYTEPRFSENGRVVIPGHITVLQNGVLTLNNQPISGPTEYKGLPVYQSHGKASIKLQDHGNPVSYRNIWVREL